MTWPLAFKLALLVVVVAVALFGHYIPAWLMRRRALRALTTTPPKPAVTAICKFEVVERSPGAVEQLRSVQECEALFYSITYSDTPWWTQAMQEIRRVHRLEAEIFAYMGGGPAVPQ